jgi:Flp pilus assembly protein TadD
LADGPAAAVARWALLVALVAATYGATVRADFVNWDDPVHVYESSRVVAPDAVRRSWSEVSPPGYYPVLFTTYRLEWLAGAHRPWLFHLDNVVLHAANAIFVGALALELAMPPLVGWLAAALWALHPVHVESVAWITERKNVLYGFLWLASLLVYLRGGRSGRGPRPGGYAVSLLLFILALLSKGAAMTLPAAIVLAEWTRGRRLDRRFWLGLLPYVVLAVAGGVGLVHNVGPTIRVPPLGTRLAVACRAFWVYVAIFLWPHPLMPVYPGWSVAWTDPRNILAAIGLIAVLVALGWAATRVEVPRLVVFGAGLFVTNVILVLGIVWNSYGATAFVADRYLYVPAIGLAIAAVAAVTHVARAALPERVPALLVTGWCAVLGMLAWSQVPVWHDSVSLWRYAVAHHPDCSPCLGNLGQALAERGDLDGAARSYEAALRLGPNEPGTAGLCTIRVRQRRTEEAVPLCELAVRLAPDSPGAHRALAVVRVEQQRLPEAVEQYETAIRLGFAGAPVPDGLPTVINDLAGVLVGAGRVGDAVRVLEDGMTRLPDAAMLPTSLAWIRATSTASEWRNGPEAVRLAERACTISGNHDVDALEALAAAYAEVGRFGDATRAARQALGMVDPGSARGGQVRQRLALYESGRPYRE